MIRVSFLMLPGRMAVALESGRDRTGSGTYQSESSGPSSGVAAGFRVSGVRISVSAPDKSPRFAEDRGSPSFLLGEWS